LTLKAFRGWSDIVHRLREYHWRMRKRDNKWNHYCCSDCVVVGDAVKRFKMIVGRGKSGAV